MLFAIIATDNKNMLETRLAERPDHVEFLTGLGKSLVFAGPFLDDKGQPNGSLVVIEADNIEHIKEVAARDPYQKANLFRHVDIRPWIWSLNNNEER